MDQGFRLLCPVEARRLLLLMGLTVALIIVVQHFEFPDGRALSSLFARGNISSFKFRESSTNSQMLGNITIPNGLNSTDTGELHELINRSDAPNVKKETSEGKDSKEKDGSPTNNKVSESNGVSSNSFGLVSNGTVSDDPVEQNGSSSLEISQGGYAGEKAMGLEISSISEVNGSSDANHAFSSFASPPINASSNETLQIDAKLTSPTEFVNSSSSSMSKDAAVTLKEDNKSLSLSSNYSLSGSGSFTSRAPAAKRKQSKKRPSRVISISQMNDLLQKSRGSSHLVRLRWPSEVDQEMLFAKSQIEKAPEIKNEAGLYAPIYRNFSMFRRSYELMENILKVYVYQEGERPIFHQSILNGIYASEGWFMKLMEANEKFVTKDPRKAHLFYIPFSSRLLELTLYVRKSHSRNNLIQYMKNYVDMIAAKYSFWNRTDGADHFLAACHDWAPAETRGRMLNSIRALCNADIEVGFSIGKDVSLPETYVASAQNPLKNLEGNPPSQRPILAFFAGNVHGYLRPILLDYWENKDPDMKIFGPMPHVRGNANYIQHMKSSKYCICAKGFEVNSPRIVEAIFYECIPVIISDNYVPPFFEVLDWESFAVFVMERDIPNLKRILLSISDEMYVEMHKRVKMVQQHFLWHPEPVKYDLFHMILHSVWYNRVFRMKSI